MGFLGVGENATATPEWKPGQLGGVCGGTMIPECKKFYGAITDEALAAIACCGCAARQGRG